MDFSKASAVITGGSSGIGLALAKQLAAQGADVWILARNEKRLDQAVSAIREKCLHESQRVGSISADVSNLEEIRIALEKHVESVGVPDLVINSAGVAHPGRFVELEDKIFRWMMDVNYFGTVNMLKILVPHMIARKSGHVVNVSSAAGFLGVYGYSAYGGSKYALRGFTDVLRAELKPEGVRVSLAFPPDTDTPQLVYEDQFKPSETRALAGTVKAMSADAVASAILKGVQKNKYLILPGETAFLFRLAGFLGRAVYPIMDLLIKQAQRKSGQQ